MTAAEFRAGSDLNQPYVWQPPMIIEAHMPAPVINGMIIPAHRELKILVSPPWVRLINLLIGRYLPTRFLHMFMALSQAVPCCFQNSTIVKRRERSMVEFHHCGCHAHDLISFL